MEKKLLLEQFNKDFAAMQRGMMMQFDKLPLPVYVLRVEADASGLPQDFIFVYANSACASFLGIDGKNYLLGMSFSDIWGDNGAKWLNIYTKTALEGLTQNIEDYNENLKKYLSVDCYQPMYGYCGCFMRDVTQRRDMERQLYEEKERYRVAMESSIDLLFEYDIRLQVMHSWSNIASENSQEKTRRSYIPDYLSVVIKENLVDPSDREAWLGLLRGERSEEALEIRMRRYIDEQVDNKWYLVQATTVYEQGLPVRVVGTMRDIDAWKRMQQEKQLVESLNYEINHVLGDIYYAVVHFDLDAGTYHFVELTKALTEENSGYVKDVRLINKFGEEKWYRIHINSIWDKENYGVMLSIVGRMVSIDKMKREIGLWKRQAESDALTKLGNRAYGERLLQQMLCEPQKEKAAVMFLDVDNFKMVNDRHGHLFGDEVLCRIANEISKQFRIDDIVCRIGGDEFLIIMRNIKDSRLPLMKADELRAGIEKLGLEADVQVPLSISVGVSFYPVDGTDDAVLLYKADKALYEAKKRGKNNCVIYSKELENEPFMSQITAAESE